MPRVAGASNLPSPPPSPHLAPDPVSLPFRIFCAPQMALQQLQRKLLDAIDAQERDRQVLPTAPRPA